MARAHVGAASVASGFRVVVGDGIIGGVAGGYGVRTAGEGDLAGPAAGGLAAVPVTGCYARGL